MNWGTNIIIAFVLFVGLVVTMVTISMRQDVSLVSKDYYVQEIAYQEQIERIENNQKLGEAQPSIQYDGTTRLITVKMPKSYTGNGEIYFFRPSEAALDAKYVLKSNQQGLQVFDARDFKKGLWRIKISWNEKGKDFYKEETLVI